jgi:hypothetical protein
MRCNRFSAVLFVVLTTFLIAATPGQSQQKKPGALDFHTAVMMSTLRIEGKNSLGTVFIVGRPHPTEQKKLRYTLVTAAHVLKDIKSDFAILHLRRQLEDGRWQTMPTPIQIREGAKRLWVEHGQADVAAMYIGVPEQAIVSVIPLSILAEDDLLAKYQIHPGDLLDCLGYPLGVQSSEGGFPVLRSGKIASYPLLPTKNTKTFLLDFRVFPGNSGGPVYISFTGERIYGGAINMGTAFNFVMGLVSEEIRVTEKLKQLYSVREEQTPLGLAKIIHASLIRETIALLPPPEL